MISIYLVDDHPMIRTGLRGVLEAEQDIRVIGEASSGEEAYPECLKEKPDVIITDLTMPGEGGLSFMRRLLTKLSSARVLVMSMHDDKAFIINAMQLGAMGYVCKSEYSDELVKAVRSIAAGEKWVSHKTAQQMDRENKSETDHPLEKLTTREFEIFLLLSKGHSVNNIALLLHISPKTVNVHRANIMEKLNAKNAVELAHIAMRQKLIQP